MGPSPWRARLGLTLYDLMAGATSLPRHSMLSTQNAVRLEPRLRAEGLQAAALFHDAQMNDARLTLETALDARDHGASILTRVEATELLESGGRVRGVLARDRRNGEAFPIEAALTVNAAGPWYSELLSKQRLIRPRALRFSRGTHVVVPPLTRGEALLLRAQSDQRVFFVMPWKGQSLVGTTEVELDRVPRDVTPTEEEIDYLLRELALQLDGPTPGRSDVLHAFAGVRVLAGGETDPGDVSREESIEEEAPGLLGVFGGKYTTHRAIAERVVDMAGVLMERELPRCLTAEIPLPGGDIPDLNDYFEVAEKLLIREFDLEPPSLRYLIATYGSRHTDLLKILRESPWNRELLEPGLPFLRGEIIHSVRNELAQTLDDVLFRRTWRGFLGPLSSQARDRWTETLEQARASEPSPT